METFTVIAGIFISLSVVAAGKDICSQLDVIIVELKKLNRKRR